MLVAKYFLLVILFVFTLKTTKSFILLTANVADIKKIAQKFVSDDMADKLAHTVVKVIKNLNNKKGSNIDDELKKIEFTTEENNEIFKNPKYERNDLYNIPKGNDQQRFKKATRTPDEDFTFNDSSEYVKSIYKSGHKKRTTKYLNNWEMNIKSQGGQQFTSREQPKKPMFAEMKSVSHQHKPKHPIDTRTTKTPVEYTINSTRQTYHNYESNEVKSRYVPEIKPILSSESMNTNKKLFDSKLSSDPKIQKSYNRFEPSVSDDDEPHHVNNNNRKQPDKKQSWENNETEKVTTKREKFNFDQYDNLNYPKMGSYIATSGPVALSAIPMEKQWWEKDFPDRRKIEN